MNDRGSIFLETIVSFAILAAILAAAFDILQQSAARAARADRQLGALLIAQSRLAAYPLTVPAATGSNSGLDGRYRWRVDARPFSQRGLSSPRGAPVQISVTVTSLNDTGARVTLSTLRPGPRG